MFNSIGRSSNFAQAGKSAADETVRAFAASRRNSTDFGKLTQKAATLRSGEKIAAMKAAQHVTKAGINAAANVKTNEVKIEGETALRKGKRKAGALAAGGKLIASAGEYLNEPRKKRTIGSEDSWYDSQIKAQEDQLVKYSNLLNDKPNSSTTVSNTSTSSNSGGKTVAPSSNTSSGGVISSFDKTGQKGKYSVADMTQFAIDAGFTPEQARTMGAIGMGESGGNPGIDTVQSGLDPNKSGEYSIGIFQINAQAHGDKLAKLGYTEDDLRDPAKNAQVAKMVHDEVGGFTPWSVYKSNKHTPYLQ